MPGISRNFPRRVSGFTLIELLVVVAIIALLIGILVPSLSRAQERANLAVCMSNLRQLGIASFMYQNANQGRFPDAAGGSTGSPYDWVFWEPTRNRDNGALVPYMGGHFNQKIYTCPSDPLTRPHQIYGSAGAWNGSYTANVHIFGGTTRYVNISSPSTKIMIVEEDATTIDDAAWVPENYNQSSNDNVLAVRHDKLTENRSILNFGKGAVNFCDGHSEFVQRGDVNSATTGPHWWNPTVP